MKTRITRCNPRSKTILRVLREKIIKITIGGKQTQRNVQVRKHPPKQFEGNVKKPIIQGKLTQKNAQNQGQLSKQSKGKIITSVREKEQIPKRRTRQSETNKLKRVTFGKVSFEPNKPHSNKIKPVGIVRPYIRTSTKKGKPSLTIPRKSKA